MNTPNLSDDRLIEGLARVVGIDGDQAWLTAEQPSACSSCGTRSKCGSGHASRVSRWRTTRAFEPGQPLLALGDTVRVGVDRQALTRASVVAYMLPLICMLVAASALQAAGDVPAMLAALLGLGGGVMGARVLTRRWRDALVPVVLGRAPGTASSACPSSGTDTPRKISIPVIHQRSQ